VFPDTDVLKRKEIYASWAFYHERSLTGSTGSGNSRKGAASLTSGGEAVATMAFLPWTIADWEFLVPFALFNDEPADAIPAVA